MEGCQGQHDLNRHVLTPAKGAANRRVDDPHLVFWQAQGMGDLLLVFMRPLPGDLDGDPALLVHVAHPRFGLEVGMLLSRREVLALDHHLRPCQGCSRVSLANAVVVKDVAAALRVNKFSVGVHGRHRIEHGRQIEVVHCYHPCGRFSLRLGLGDHQRYLVPDKADAVGPRLGRTRPAQHGLIRHDQAILIDGHVLGGQHRQHTGHAFGGRSVHLADEGVWSAGKEDLHHGLIGAVDVTGVQGSACDLAHRVQANGRTTDSCHSPPLEREPGCPSESRCVLSNSTDRMRFKIARLVE